MADNVMCGDRDQDQGSRICNMVGTPLCAVHPGPPLIPQPIARRTVLGEQRRARLHETADVVDSRPPDLDLVHARSVSFAGMSRPDTRPTPNRPIRLDALQSERPPVYPAVLDGISDFDHTGSGVTGDTVGTWR